MISILMKFSGLGFSLITAVILARHLGPEQYGHYSFALAIVSILAIPAMFGLPNLLVRETAKAETLRDWGTMRGLWSWANRVTLVLSISLMVLFLSALWLYQDASKFDEPMLFVWAALFIPLSALAALRSASLRGLKKVIQGQLPEQIIKPVCFVTMLLAVVVVGQYELDAEQAMLFNVLATSVAFIAGAWLLMKAKPNQMFGVERKYQSKEWALSVIPLALISGLEVIVTQSDIVMIGIFSTAYDVGIYRVAMQGAVLASVGIAAVNMVMAPHYTKLFNENDIDGLRKLSVSGARFSIVISLFVFLIMFFHGEFILDIFFGEEYVEALSVLLILVFAQVMHAAGGSGGMMLIMCGYEKGTLITLLLAAILNLILNYIFIPMWGVDGAAFATGISVFIRKVVIWIMVYRKFRIDTSIFGILFTKQ